MFNKFLLALFSLMFLLIISCSDDDGGTITGPDDTTAPSAISTLATGDVTGASVELNWISTGDDENIGKAREYDIRYSTTMITELNFNSVNRIATDSLFPKVSGYNESFVVDDLMPESKYYFAIKAADEEANWSDISNIDSATTNISGTWENITGPLPSTLVNDILVSGSDVYYGTDFGLAHFDGTDWKIYQHDENDTSSIIGDYITSLAMGSDNVLWIGTSDGLSRFEDSVFTNYTDTTSGLTTNEIKTLAIEGNSDKVWVGTGSRGLFLFENSLWTNYNRSNSDLAQNSIASLALDYLGHLWIGLNFGGAAYYDGITFSSHNSGNGFTSNGVWDITFDKDNDVWVGTDNGAAVYDGSSWTFYTTANSPLIDDVVISITAVPNSLGFSTIYIGTRDGLNSFTTVNWRTITTSNSQLPNSFINCLTTTQVETVYIGTQNGATIYVE